ncbi:MAG TPA: patatin-like phospholipase family protein [Bacteroidota bacterium]|nr:patatin-like phospholipase family protein [Bacteroidota bacterium]
MTGTRAHGRGFSLVLGGGGARGLAHIGVLRVLEKNDLRPSLIVGTSMGAIIGGMYAQLPDARLVEERIRALIRSKPFRRIVLDAFSQEGAPDSLGTVSALYGRMKRGYSLLRSVWSPGIVQAPILIDFLSHLLDDTSFAKCRIPFAAVACDLLTGREVVCRTGSMLNAIAASSAIPGVVTPVILRGKWLVDGAPTSMVPVDAARRLSGLPAVAVTVTKSVEGSAAARNAIDVVLRAGAIARMQLAEQNLKNAAVVLRPGVGEYGWADFQSVDRFVREGEREARKVVRRISVL